MRPISYKISRFTAKNCLISRTQATILSKTNHYAKPLRIRMDITSTCFHMLLLLQLFPHMPQPWMCDPCTAPWCYTQTASYLRHTCRAYASTRAEDPTIQYHLRKALIVSMGRYSSGLLGALPMAHTGCEHLAAHLSA